jgi:hypothetical protein
MLEIFKINTQKNSSLFINFLNRAFMKWINQVVHNSNASFEAYLTVFELKTG